MSVFSARGFTAATAATADHAITTLWNPDSAKRIKLIEAGLFKAGAGTSGDSLYMIRTSTRGTAGTTVTPDADNAWDGDDIPSSGALMDLAAFSGQPTLQGPGLFGWVAGAASASGFIWPCPRGIWIPPGKGIALCQRAATIWPTSEAYFEWEE
jgi:hypothetical protein